MNSKMTESRDGNIVESLESPLYNGKQLIGRQRSCFPEREHGKLKAWMEKFSGERSKQVESVYDSETEGGLPTVTIQYFLCLLFCYNTKQGTYSKCAPERISQRLHDYWEDYSVNLKITLYTIYSIYDILHCIPQFVI